jgi:predicted ATP-grasp superfamily ATP-dependent carboligase
MNYASITMRAAMTADATAIARLSELEEDRPLTGDVLVAEGDGAVIAALSIDENRAVADIFKPTAEIVSLLRSRRQAIVARP